MGQYVRRFEQRVPLNVKAGDSDLKLSWEVLERGGSYHGQQPGVDVLLVVLEGTVMLSRPTPSSRMRTTTWATCCWTSAMTWPVPRAHTVMP